MEGATDVVQKEFFREGLAQTPLKDGSPKQVPPALRAHPGLENEHPERDLRLLRKKRAL